MGKELILDNFEHGDLSNYQTNNTYVDSYQIDITQKRSKFGSNSLRVSYDYGGWKKGNGAMPIRFKSRIQVDEMPIKIGVWVYGEGEVPWLRVTILDGNDERKTLNLTEETMSWHGWKYVDAKINPNWSLPIQLEQIYAVEIDKSKQGNNWYSGFFYFDQIRFVYNDYEDLKGPLFYNTYPVECKIYKDNLTFRTVIFDEQSGVDPNTIIVKVNNRIVDHLFNAETNELRYPINDLSEGLVHIVVYAKDLAGNLSIPSLEKKYQVDLSPDIEKPILSNITPTETAIVYTDQPRISFYLIDKKSGIDPKDIVVKINGMVQYVYYDMSTGWAYALSKHQLATGSHTFTIEAKDRAGNAIDPVTKSFTIAHLEKLTDKKDVFIAIIPDTHSAQYGKLAINHVTKENVDFVIHMGDLVDEATSEEFKNVEKNIRLFGEIPLLTVPGNHESFQGNLHKYMEIFGSPTYHLVYGGTLFIFLNSAYNQSITASDSTQFHYINTLLDRNAQKNIVLVTHVPITDPFDTAHEMDQNDAVKLEMILANYKKNNPNKNITVLFGHAHALHSWEKSGVQYIITGNGARKSYVSPEQGSILGHGIIELTNQSIKYQYKPYIQELYIFNEHVMKEELVMQKGSSVQLHVHIKVDELDSHYKVNISQHALIHQKWTSFNEDIIRVNEQGLIYAIEKGETFAVVKISDKAKQIKVVVID